MAGPSRRAGQGGPPGDTDQQLLHFGSQEVAVDSLQVALPLPNRDRGFGLMDPDDLPLQSFDPVLAQLLDETACDAGPIGDDQFPETMFDVIRPPAPATQQPASGGRIDGFPSRRNTRIRREARLAATDERHRVHIMSERNRRREMSEQFAALRRMLPSSSTLSRMDRSSVVMGAINFISALEVELERLRSSAQRTEIPTNGGLVCVDHTGDANALTAITALPAPGSDPSAMASFLGTNVALQICGQNCFITVSSPHRVSHLQQYTQIFMVLFGHHLEVLSGSIATRDDTVVYTIACQAHPNANLLSNDLHAALQNVVNEFIIRTN